MTKNPISQEDKYQPRGSVEFLWSSTIYIVMNDLPKIENLKRLFPDLYRANPVLVATAAPRS